MTTEALLSIHLEVALAIVNNYFVIHGLTRKILHVWMHRSCRHRMHVWLAYVLGHNGDAELPNIHLFVISSRDKSSAILNESNRIDGAEMFLVLLHNLLRISVELKNFLV